MSNLVQHGLACDTCGSSDALAEYTDNWFCFSCKASKQKARGRRDYGQAQHNTPHSDSPPPFYTREKLFDRRCVALFKKAHLTPELVRQYNIQYTKNLNMWSEKRNGYFNAGARLIIPHPGGFEARALDTHDKLKYITWGHKDCLFKSDSVTDECEDICIVEDIFSAIRVGQHMSCVALLGTNWSRNKELEFMSLSPYAVFIWLDSDTAGQSAVKKIQDRASWVCDEVNIIQSQEDPKCLTDNEIQELLYA